MTLLSMATTYKPFSFKECYKLTFDDVSFHQATNQALKIITLHAPKIIGMKHRWLKKSQEASSLKLWEFFRFSYLLDIRLLSWTIASKTTLNAIEEKTWVPFTFLLKLLWTSWWRHHMKHVVTPFYYEKNMDKKKVNKWITMHYLLN